MTWTLSQATGQSFTGLASVKFDIPDSPTRRFRLVYGDIDAETRGVLAIGVRDDHAIYRLAVDRIRTQEEPGRPERIRNRMALANPPRAGSAKSCTLTRVGVPSGSQLTDALRTPPRRPPARRTQLVRIGVRSHAHRLHEAGGLPHNVRSRVGAFRSSPRLAGAVLDVLLEVDRLFAPAGAPQIAQTVSTRMCLPVAPMTWRM